MLITIQEYADLHGRDKKAVEYHMRKGRIPFIEKYDKRLIDNKTKYPKPIGGKGRKPLTARDGNKKK